MHSVRTHFRRFFGLFYRDLEPFEVEATPMGNDRYRVTTRLGDDVQESVAVVFTPSEVEHIDAAKARLEETVSAEEVASAP